MSLVRRLTWHPATAAALLAAAAVAGVTTMLPLSDGADRLWPWLLTGAAAGFATSGST